MRSLVAALIATVLASSLAGRASGEPADTIRPAPAADGRGLGALPGLYRVATADAIPRDVALFIGAGYGFAGSVIEADDTHHRANGELAAAVGLTRWLALGLRLDGRYDRHQGADDMVDGGVVGDPRLSLRAVNRVSDSLGLAAQLTLWMPGSNAPSIVTDAATVDAMAAASYTGAGGALRLGGNVGFRLDNSARSADNAAMLSQPDRLSLGVSDSSAVLLGAGLAYRVGRVELVGEWTWDLLVGDQAPELRTSPMRVAGGLRAAVASTMVAQLIVEVSTARFPATDAGQPLSPFEPRWSVSAGLLYSFGAAGKPAPGTPVQTNIEVVDKPRPPPTVLVGTVVDEAGAPISGAAIVVTQGTASKEASSDKEGHFRIDDVAPGTVEVAATKEGFQQRTQSVAVTAGTENEVSLALEAEVPPAQIRGYVRSYKGTAVKATLRVEPIGVETETQADGSFQLDVPPGDYEVVVKAPGFREQRRPVKVEKGGVTIVNVDFERKK